ncbi:MAG: hypothetical protein J6B12_04825, partial [Clostridia bacterium]|nr:hypothetical protein [Clostridia bacterium]
MRNKKKLTAWLLACLMVVSLISTSVAASDVHEHDYTTETIIREADCDTRGIVKLTCDCGNSSYAQIDFTHDYAEETVAPTCGEAGKTVYTCACGDTYEEEIPATGEHSMEDTILDATCTEPEKVGEVCSVC